MDMNAYALLDMGKSGVPHAPFHPKGCFIASAGLFEGTPEERLIDKGPWLAKMETYRGFDYRDYVQREIAPHGAATWLTTPMPFEETFQHLRHSMQIQKRDGGSGLLRFWDGHVFQRLGYILRADQYAALTGPFSRWETTTHPKVSYVGHPEIRSRDECGFPLTLESRQVAMLAMPLMKHVDRRLAMEIWQGMPRARAGREPNAILAAVRQAYRYALEGLRLADLRTVANWVKADAGWAMGLHSQQSIELRVRTATSPELVTEDILSALRSAGRFGSAR